MGSYCRDVTNKKSEGNLWCVNEQDNIEKYNHLLDSLLDICNDSNYKDCYFRGQSNPYDPVAGIFRDQYNHILKNEIEYYSTIIADHSSELIGIEEVLDLFSLIQHYGYPTRLLDITKNPMIAIQFMISGDIHESGHTMYIFKPKAQITTHTSLGTINEINSFKKLGDFPILRVGNSQNKNRRIETQKGLFIYFDEKNNYNNNIDNLHEKYGITRIKIIFERMKDHEELRKDLGKYHYYSYNLYPDLVSKVDYYKTEWKQEKPDQLL